VTRRDLVRAISPSRTGTVKSAWNPWELSRPKAAKVVNIFFDSIAAALKKGEKVTLPIGTLEVVDQTRARKCQWIRGRLRVINKQRKRIQFTPSAQCPKQLAGRAEKGWRMYPQPSRQQAACRHLALFHFNPQKVRHLAFRAPKKRPAKCDMSHFLAHKPSLTLGNALSLSF